MIIAKLLGGMGNQMFQYSLGRALGLKADSPFKLDISNFATEGTPRRQYELGIFTINESFASNSEIANLRPPTNKLIQLSPKLQRLVAALSPYYSNEYYSHGKLPSRPKDLYIEGNWQSEDYFSEYSSIIRADFTFKTPPSAKVRVWLKRIKTSTAISIHVRRTDYVHRSSTQKPIPGCSLNYYRHSIKIMAKKLKAPVFYVFSDDPIWAKKHISFKGYRFFYPVNSPHDDLRLMSSCRHHIVANSSFSWWGAWLNPYKQKIVIAPTPWFEESINHFHTIVPKGWLQIPKQ